VSGTSDTSRQTLHALSRAVLDVASHLSVEEVLQRIVSSARELLNARYAALGVPDDQGSFAQFVVDGVSDEQWREIGPLPRQHGLLGVMLREARPQRLADIRADPRFWGWPAAHPELVGFLGVPIVDHDAILGAIYLANKRDGGGFTADDEALLLVLAGHAAIALTNARLYERSRELTLVEERTRLARELHDAVAQKLFSLRLTAGAAAALVSRDPERAREELARVQQLSADALGELRSAIFQLRPAELSDDGLADTLAKHVEVLRRIHGVRIDWSVSDWAAALPPEREDALFRVAQEALQNALRHSGADRVAVSLRAVNGSAVLEVSDAGTGFDVAAARQSSRRLGLSSMRARAREAGGRLTVTSTPGVGTTVRLEVPHG
jgi:signal transduction histidine kinase